MDVMVKHISFSVVLLCTEVSEGVYLFIYFKSIGFVYCRTTWLVTHARSLQICWNINVL